MKIQTSNNHRTRMLNRVLNYFQERLSKFNIKHIMKDNQIYNSDKSHLSLVHISWLRSVNFHGCFTCFSPSWFMRVWGLLVGRDKGYCPTYCMIMSIYYCLSFYFKSPGVYKKIYMCVKDLYQTILNWPLKTNKTQLFLFFFLIFSP